MKKVNTKASLADDKLGNLQFSARAELDRRRRSQDEEKEYRDTMRLLKLEDRPPQTNMLRR